MSSATWTPRALASEARPLRLALWRAVEAQHSAATRALVDTQAEQELLERVLEAHKPAIPEPCRALDYLLFTPFRYPPVQYGSRFRAVGDPGVWYGADEVRSACAEVGYWRTRFIADSRGLSALEAVAHTVFRAGVRGAGVDLRTPPFKRAHAYWMHAYDYAPCQALARAAREASLGLLRYASVRDPQHGGCAAVLDCTVFAGGRGITQRQTWFLSADANRASWVRTGGAHRAESFEFVYR